jgi:hypothetical protein
VVEQEPDRRDEGESRSPVRVRVRVLGGSWWVGGRLSGRMFASVRCSGEGRNNGSLNGQQPIWLSD